MALGMPTAVRTSAHSSAWLDVGATRIGCMSDLRPKVVAGDDLAYPLAHPTVPVEVDTIGAPIMAPLTHRTAASPAATPVLRVRSHPTHAKKGQLMRIR